MMNRIKVGTAWAQKETGECIVIVGSSRTGHQYDRYWLLEALYPDGKIHTIEDYNLTSHYKIIDTAESIK